MALSDYQQQNYTYGQGLTVDDWLRSTEALRQGQDFNTWANAPSDFYQGQKPLDILRQISGGQVTDPMNQRTSALPDPIAGSLIPSGNDLGGFMLALAPLAAMVGGAAGVGGLSNAGWGGAVEGAAAGGLGDAASGVNALGGAEGAGLSAVDAAAGLVPEFGTSAAYGAGIGNPAYAGLLDAGASTGGLLGNPSPLLNSGGSSLSDLSRIPTGGGGGAGSGNPDPGFEGYGGTPASQAGGGTLQSALDWMRRNPGLVSLGGSVLSSGIGALGSYAASRAQQRSGQQGIDALMSMYNQNRADLEPWRTAGVGALGNLVNLTTPGRQLDTAMLDPGYAFRQAEGEKAIDRAASARGRYYAPATMQALDRYNQNYATNEFSNVYNRNANLAGLGQVGTTAGVAAGANMAKTQSELLGSMGNARASGYMGMANAAAGGIGQGLNLYNQLALLEALRGGG